MEKERGLIGDFFCGAGGASVGIEEAFGRSVDFAVNHDQTAIEIHSRNHPETYHMTEDIFTSDVEKFVSGRKVSLLWASPDCTHLSTIVEINNRYSTQYATGIFGNLQ